MHFHLTIANSKTSMTLSLESKGKTQVLAQSNIPNFCKKVFNDDLIQIKEIVYSSSLGINTDKLVLPAVSSKVAYKSVKVGLSGNTPRGDFLDALELKHVKKTFSKSLLVNWIKSNLFFSSSQFAVLDVPVVLVKD